MKNITDLINSFIPQTKYDLNHLFEKILKNQNLNDLSYEEKVELRTNFSTESEILINKKIIKIINNSFFTKDEIPFLNNKYQEIITFSNKESFRFLN